MPTKPAIYQLKIALQHIKPQIWRRVLVPADATLEALHQIIQAVMPWQDYHLHHFQQGETYYGVPFPEMYEYDLEYVDTRLTPLHQVLARKGGSILYEYDFGDSWWHDIVLEKILKPEPGVLYPVCNGGERVCPPEDCGGVTGYYLMLEALSDPQHEEYESYEIWSNNFQPEAFDLDQANARLRVRMAELDGLFRMINRTVVVIKPKQPMLDWINQNDEGGMVLTLEDIQRDSTALLTPDMGSDEEVHAYLHDLKPLLFEKELMGWYLHQEGWPEPRTAELFDEWFDLEIHSMVWDTARDIPVEHE
jgi:hypothetical protein